MMDSPFAGRRVALKGAGMGQLLVILRVREWWSSTTALPQSRVSVSTAVMGPTTLAVRLATKGCCTNTNKRMRQRTAAFDGRRREKTHLLAAHNAHVHKGVHVPQTEGGHGDVDVVRGAGGDHALGLF